MCFEKPYMLQRIACPADWNGRRSAWGFSGRKDLLALNQRGREYAHGSSTRYSATARSACLEQFLYHASRRPRLCVPPVEQYWRFCVLEEEIAVRRYRAHELGCMRNDGLFPVVLTYVARATM